MSVNTGVQEPMVRKNPNVKKYDNGIVGLLSGLAVIVLGVVVIKFLRHGSYTFGDYLKFFYTFENPFLLSEASKILSLALFGLLAPFYFFLNRKCYMAARGVLISAMIAAAFIIMYKFVW